MSKNTTNLASLDATFETAADARVALQEAGFAHGFSSPGRPSLWVNMRNNADRRAVGKADGEDCWIVVVYPEPSVCTPGELTTLSTRDRILETADNGPTTRPLSDEDLEIMREIGLLD